MFLEMSANDRHAKQNWRLAYGKSLHGLVPECPQQRRGCTPPDAEASIHSSERSLMPVLCDVSTKAACGVDNPSYSAVAH